MNNGSQPSTGPRNKNSRNKHRSLIPHLSSLFAQLKLPIISLPIKLHTRVNFSVQRSTGLVSSNATAVNTLATLHAIANDPQPVDIVLVTIPPENVVVPLCQPALTYSSANILCRNAHSAMDLTWQLPGTAQEERRPLSAKLLHTSLLGLCSHSDLATLLTRQPISCFTISFIYFFSSMWIFTTIFISQFTMPPFLQYIPLISCTPHPAVYSTARSLLHFAISSLVSTKTLVQYL